ncbi:hypothetical protein [uncultured Pelagimonas sp.]|uniref:hypothetical protein n=1 Tax=uncultured Pelagimonas sp. TaxID=1618102 RepID=UPI0026166177|nr:hypothetical protein [uncultured Pelagimonas sp.]
MLPPRATAFWRSRGSGGGDTLILVAVVVAVFGAVAFAVSGAGAVAVVVVGPVGRASAGIFVVVSAVAGLVASAGDFEATLFIFFFVALPIINAFADFLSLAITRRFLRHMLQNRPGHWGVNIHMGLDLLCGLACLGRLLLGLAGFLDIWQGLSPDTVPLDWRAYWAAAKSTPSEGFALRAMCFTTLIPTLVHVVWALTLWAVQKSNGTRQAVAMMRNLPAPTPDQTPIAIDDALRNDIAHNLIMGQFWGVFRAGLIWIPVLIAVLFAIYRIFLSYSA